MQAFESGRRHGPKQFSAVHTTSAAQHIAHPGVSPTLWWGGNGEILAVTIQQEAESNIRFD